MKTTCIRPDAEGLCEIVEWLPDGETVLLYYPEGGHGYWPIASLQLQPHQEVAE